eukprot:TRINITY_DN17633_c0_g1_i1.p1 TRINITY_DN17633_c0_g1~~TRINITY_DN17633_c0_g1_i1.p1  ORF type:complete len:858 (-),score=130.26 TRINITY_DN17633_c0_g1_i1:623-3196(-)
MRITPVLATLLLLLVPTVVVAQDGSVDDIKVDGACKAAIEQICKDIQAGEGRVADCLTYRHAEEAEGKVEGKKLIQGACKKELLAFWVQAGSSFEKNPQLQKKCKKDAEKLGCMNEELFGEQGATIACLRQRKSQVSDACAEEITLLQEEATQDYRVDPQLKKYCEEDAKKFCESVEAGDGGVQKCLREKITTISWDCREELERQEVEDADDIRLSTTLYRACLADKQKFCSDLPAGNGRVIACLIDSRQKKGFTKDCGDELVKVMQKRMSNFMLDPQLQKVCERDIFETCGFELDGIDTGDSHVTACLEDFREELIDDGCKQYVHKLMKQQFSDIRLDIPLADACREDRDKLCGNIPAGSAGVITCLQDHRKELSDICKATLFDQEVLMAEDIDFKYPMKQSCEPEIQKFCKSVPHGHARIIRCLQENMDKEGFGAECRQQVLKDQQRSSQDYRLNFRLQNACEKDRQALCADVCNEDQGNTACGGRVLQCLTDKIDDVKQEDCQNELFYFIKMEITDFRNDVTLAEMCREDVDKFCGKIEKGVGKVHRCLRDNLKDLSEGCRAEEMKLMQLQSRDVRLQPTLMKACQSEMYMYCQRISPGGGRVFKCLQKNLGQNDFSAECAQEVKARSELMQTDYRLDYSLKNNCKKDAASLCQEATKGPHKAAAVIKCLIKNYDDLEDGCAREMSRAVRMALWTYKPNGAITGVCDADVNATCSAVAKNMRKKAFGIGVVGRCLSKQVAEEKTFQSDECRQLITMTVPKDMAEMFTPTGGSMDSVAIVEKLSVLEQKLNMPNNALVQSGRISGFGSLAFGGWVLIGTMVVVLAAVIALIVLGIRNVFSQTIVVKPGQFKDGGV